MKKFSLMLVVLVVALAGVFAQRRFGGGGYGGYRGGWGEEFENARTPREIPQHGDTEDGRPYETPRWTNAPGFEKDVFTFVRIKRARGGYTTGGSWWTD